MPEQIMQYILQYSVLALGLVASLCLFLSLKRELHLQRQKHCREIDEIRSHLKSAAEQEPVQIISPPVPHSGFNLSRRVQAMRLSRRGEGAEHIAAALGVPDREVELLLRVQRMSAENSTQR